MITLPAPIIVLSPILTPGRIVVLNDKRVDIDLDQVHLPDPVKCDIEELRGENIFLKDRVETLEAEISTLHCVNNGRKKE